jgi:hypothetical protein
MGSGRTQNPQNQGIFEIPYLHHESPVIEAVIILLFEVPHYSNVPIG